MKKILYAAVIFISTSVAAMPNTKALNNFAQSFPGAVNVKWSDDKAGYFVSFYQNQNFEKVLYSKTGNFICSWKYNDGKSLPTNIQMTLNKKFKGAHIFGVTEVTQADNTMYDVKLQNDKEWYCVKLLSTGSIISEDNYSKQ